MAEDYLLMLARSVMDRQVEVGGRQYAVRPPSILHAIQLFSFAKGVGSSDADDIKVWRQILLRWLGKTPVYSAICDLPSEEQVRFVLGLLRAESVSLNDVEESSPNDPLDTPTVRWDILIIDYCSVYGAGNPWEVVCDTPWPFFMLMCRRLDQAKARSNAWRLENELIPHAGKEAPNLMRQMRQRAGQIVEPGRKSKENLYRQSLDRLKGVFGNPSKRENLADLKEK